MELLFRQEDAYVLIFDLIQQGIKRLVYQLIFQPSSTSFNFTEWLPEAFEKEENEDSAIN